MRVWFSHATVAKESSSLGMSATVSARVAVVLVLALLVSACGTAVVRRDSPVRSTRSSPEAVRSVPKYGVTATVQKGDTLYGIAFRNRIDMRDLAAWNGLDEPYTIYPGQRLRLYPATARAATVSRPREASAPAVVKAPPAPVVPPVSGVEWGWPADGELIGRYVAGQPTRQGIDIAGSSGAAVRAAGDGVVVYSGSGLVGYGELVIIKHNDAWLSAYGHNRNRLVNEGQLVKRGQKIAEMGRSGAPRDMLHFEVRYNGKPVDPLLYLPAR